MNQSNSKAAEGGQTGRTVLFIASIFLLVVGTWIVVGFLPAWNCLPGFDFSTNGQFDPNRPGVFGDSFGWINSLFSALAFAGVLVTLWMQRRELKLQRDELVESRKQHERMAKAQEESENRLFLTAYMNAVESLRQLSQWRMSANPASTQTASFPTVQGLVMQARVIESLQTLMKELEPEISKLHPAIGAISVEGTRIWMLEELLSIYVALREASESYRGKSDDAESFKEVRNTIRMQLDRLSEMKVHCGQPHHSTIDSILRDSPNLDGVHDDAMRDEVSAREFRERFSSAFREINQQVLSLVMSVCHE